MTKFDVEAVERFLVRTVYRGVEAADRKAAVRRCRDGLKAYEDKEILEGDEEWIQTLPVEEN